MNEEYTYDIGKYTIGVDKSSENGIGLTIAIINDDGEIHFLGNCYGDNAMCIDLLIKENQQLKEQVEYMRRSMDEILLKLDRIERMLYTLLNDEEKEKIKNEKIKEFKEKADKYQQLFKGTYLIEKSDNQ